MKITGEILERNGFTKLGYEGWEYDGYMNVDNGPLSNTDDRKYVYNIIWRTDYGTPHLKIRSFDKEFGEFSCWGIDTVEELQTALKLCRIKLTIK